MVIKRACLFLTLITIFICGIFASCGSLSTTESDSPVTSSSEKERLGSIENAIIMPNNEGNGNYSLFDASDSHVFFSYSEQSAQVDAYNYAGEYQFSISLAHRDRGSIDIRCHDNLLYIQSKYGNVFVFDNDKLVNRFSEEEAKSRGYTSSWFDQRSIPIEKGISQIYRHKENAQNTDRIAVPHVIFLRSIYQSTVVGILIVFTAIGLIKMRKRNLLTDNKHQ